jgi:type IV pilus assembly protein PilB
MAIRASLTGHLVLTTLHTNSAIGAVARLLDLGIEHSLLANSLACLTAQRLVKKVCSVCSTPTVFSEEEDWQVYAEYFDETEQLLKASQSGCMECNNGYSGRITINEILGIDNSKIGTDVMSDIKKNFQKSTLRDDALSKIRTWETTIEAVQAILMK